MAVRNETANTGQAVHEKQNRTDRTGFVRAGPSEQDSEDRAAGIGQPGQDGQIRTAMIARTGQPE
jgi:hypothetical protein